MTATQSKLLTQLQKQSRNTQKITIDQDHMDDVYQMLTKIQSKNLMFIELLTFLIQKGFVKNQHKIYYYMDVYDSIKGIVSDQVASNFKQKQDQQQKFSKKKFVKFFKTVAKKFYPSDPLGFQNNIYKIVFLNEHQQDIRIRIDDNIKKLMTRQIINMLRNCQRELEIVYEIYLPQNFNNKMAFSWQQIKYLEKKLPIIALFRFLWDCEICPQHISPTHFFDVVSKIIPPHSLLAGSSQKQSLFYSPENIMTYAKQSVTLKKMRLLQGDIGINYFQLQVILIRLAIDVTKEKNDFAKAFQTFLSMIRLKDIIGNKGQTKQKPNRFEQVVKSYIQQTKKANKNNVQVQKRQGKKRIQQILQINEQIQEDSRMQFKDSSLNEKDLLNIKKSLDDDHLPQIPQRSLIQKQNNSKYNIEEKHVVIGEQLPKLQQKNKPAAPKKVDKKDENTRKFKLQQTVQPNLSTDHYNQIIKVHKKPRMNTQFPIILMDAVYPSDIPNLYLNPKCQIYLETAYIHLGQRSYQKAFVNYVKARTICQATKNQTAQFYFYILQAQIYEAAARDQMALLNYNKAKELANTANKDIMLKYIAYKGLACCLYHMEQYQYAMRCFMKAKQLRNDQIQVQSVQNAVMENNLGCILMIMNRNNQAMKHFAVSQSIMDLKLGKFHEKSVVVQKNQAKNKKAYIEMAPQFKTMWRTYVQKPQTKKAATTATKKK